MRKIFKILGISLMIGGWLCAGLGFTMEVPHPVNTMMFTGGIIMVLAGIIALGLVVFKR